MRTIERVKQHFETQNRLVVSVPEWGDGEAPLEIHFFPMSMEEAAMIQRVSGKKATSVENAVYSLIVKARDKDGNRIFSLNEREEMLKYGDVRVILRINDAVEKHFYQSIEEAKGNLGETPSDTTS
ncbi:MAG: hypothetical protein ACK5X3_08220 [Pseudomonadota bacterium]